MRQQKNRILSLKFGTFSKWVKRHRILFCTFISIAILYFIIRIFFTPCLLKDTHFSNAFYDRNGVLLRLTLTPDDKYRIFTPLSEISPYIQQATILYEDKYFYWHFGINPFSLLRAGIGYFSDTPHPAGASTITMQVARIKYQLNTTNPAGKLAQIAAALYLDTFYTKDEILEAYLNLAPYGGNLEGIGAASLIYFETLPENISKIESITLSTIPQNPNKRGLNTARGQNNISHMRSDLVKRWVSKYPSDKNLIALSAMPLSVRTPDKLPFLAPHFINHEIRKKNCWSDVGLKSSVIKTSIDINLQKRIHDTLRKEIATRKSRGVHNAAAILLNYKTMETLAYIGSSDYFDTEIYGENDGVQARRSPGSTLKPLIYATATDAGLIHGMTLLKDAKINFGVYAPENADNEFYGPVLAHTALTHSRNIPAINLIKQIGTKKFHKLLTDCGVKNLKSPDHYGISIALGGAEVSMYELAKIYATMANLGLSRQIKTHMNESDTSETQILSPEAFFLTLDMLSRNPPQNSHIPFTKPDSVQIHHFWKTGTSSSFRDAWTAGIFGDYVLVIWVGNFDGRPNNTFSGSKTAAPIYFSLANTVIKYYTMRGQTVTNNNFLRPGLNVSQIEMCDIVGGIAGPYCPKRVKSYFIPGVSPIDTSSVYRAVAIDKTTGLRACRPNPETTDMKVYEFWEPEFLDIFNRAGIIRNTPPPFMPGCDLNEMTFEAKPITIISPVADIKTVIVNDKDYESVSFQAISDTPTSQIFWFLNGKVIGETKSGEVFSKNIPVGEYTLHATDSQGSSTTIKFMVVK